MLIDLDNLDLSKSSQSEGVMKVVNVIGRYGVIVPPVVKALVRKWS